MPLDIGIGPSRYPAQDEPSLQLDNDGYYWFLHPLFEQLAAETGQYVDLYGDASFNGDALAALEQTLAAARDLVTSQPATWRVHVGTQTMPARKELYKIVEKTRFFELLDQWERIVARAKQSNRPVVCFGD
jgi:hypothetical protein